MSERYDAIIIGAGIIGCCTGFELAKRGYRTLNVDKLHGAGYGSTAASCAIVRFHYSTPDGVAMARESYFHWLDWARYLGVPDDAGTARYVNTGCLVFKTDRNRQLREVMASLDELRVAYEELDADGVRALVPGLDTRSFGPPVGRDDARFGAPTGDAVSGAVYLPESGFVSDPQLSCHNAQRACEARGGEFRFHAEVTEVLVRDGRAAGVRLADGAALEAPVVVNVAGPHSSRVNRLAGVEDGMAIKTRPQKHEVCHVPAPGGSRFDVFGTIISDGDTGCYLRPEAGGHVLLGSEDPACDAPDWVDDPDDWDDGFSDRWLTQVLRVAQRIPDLPVPSRPKGVVALYDVTDDWIPVYDRSDLPGFYLAVGTSGNQFKNGPVAGQLMAELITQVEGGRDHDRDPVKLPLKYTRRELDLASFSRRREINRQSSFSVIG
ncbi:MAG: FAD-binding oxidoreductase [Acidobacteriota bacterium]|nr:FAD-binding oxidoreductase [Acidobacteriota bacterium]